MKKFLSIMSMMFLLVSAMAFVSCENEKVTKAYKAAVNMDKELKKEDYDTSTVIDLGKLYIEALSELNKEERQELIEKLKKNNLNTYAKIAKLDIKNAKKIISSIGNASAGIINSIINSASEGLEKLNQDSLEDNEKEDELTADINLINF